MKKLAHYLVFLIAPTVLMAQPTGASGSWNLIFEDNFNGSSLDLSKWSYNYPWGNTHTHNHEAWCVAEQVTVQDGYLRITATDEKHPESTDGYDYTSGIITSYGKFHMDAGFIEGRLKMPATLGTWPAFWTLGDGWPPEIDILEVPFERTVHHYYMHYTNTSGGESSFGGTHSGPDKSADYHIYGVEWGPTYMFFYFDGTRIASYYRSECAQAVNQYILINLAVGGWAGTPPEGAVFPCYYDCDWVRAWEKDPNAGVEDGVYRITPSHATNQALEVGNWGTTNGSNISQWSYWGGSLQQWTITNVDGDYYSIRPVGAPDQSMDIDGQSTANGANVQTWAYWGGSNQQFSFEASGAGYTIHPRHSGKCIDIAGASTANGANVLQWDCNGGANQTFLLTQLSSGQDEIFDISGNLRVYPNPVTGSTITLKTMLPSESEVKIKIFNSQGLMVYSENIGIQNSGEMVYNLNIDNISDGLYIVNLEAGDHNEKSTFVRE